MTTSDCLLPRMEAARGGIFERFWSSSSRFLRFFRKNAQNRRFSRLFLRLQRQTWVPTSRTVVGAEAPCERPAPLRASRPRPWPPPPRCTRACGSSNVHAGRLCRSSMRPRILCTCATGGSAPAFGRESTGIGEPTGRTFCSRAYFFRASWVRYRRCPGRIQRLEVGRDVRRRDVRRREMDGLKVEPRVRLHLSPLRR